MSVKYDSISTRDAFGIALVEAAREYPNLFAIGADTTKSMGFKPMMKEFPDRVINNGIAEQNMAMIGAGIAAAGGRAVIATYAPFASMRISEQVRTFICYPNLDVKVISGLSGLSGNIEGVTHQGLEDIGVMRAVGAGDLAGALAAAVDAAARKLRAGGRVDGVALFLVARACRGDLEPGGDAALFCFFFHDEFRHGRAADVAQADKQYAYQINFLRSI